MEETGSLVLRARTGDLDAYGQLVRAFQDMSYGYAYSLLGDFHLAQDAAQEAFLQGYRDLGKLRDPEAFPGWLRRIVFKCCDRLIRGKHLPTVPCDAAESLRSNHLGPPEEVEKREAAESVLGAVRALPEDERTVTTLYYINGYSQREVAEFLGVPVTTVNNRLHASREKLREEMMGMVEDTMKAHAPGPDETSDRVSFLLRAAQRMSEGIPFMQVLALAVDEAEGKALRDAIASVRAAVEQGSPLGEAMAGHPEIFPAMVVWLVDVGEYLGEVDVTMRMAGRWLRDGEYEADPYAFAQASTYRLREALRQAMADRATALVIDSGRTAPLEDVKGRPEMVWLEREMPDSARERCMHLTNPGNIGSYLAELRMRTVLDRHQEGDELTGTFRIRLDPRDAEEATFPVSFRPYRDGEEVRIRTGG